ncbi:hypothetical protein [Alteribacter natronophilus]|uniref:hypothetical protein n=1 Tax=Alteribacter natronophilus TaxID=2583810 RepID=UPI00110E132A|nr:hypothetical protein [Alteribacter natronophilus]TMW70313.1 hypothetical protein FGB90_16695 [Alteribacter natronophilus]
MSRLDDQLKQLKNQKRSEEDRERTYLGILTAAAGGTDDGPPPRKSRLTASLLTAAVVLIGFVVTASYILDSRESANPETSMAGVDHADVAADRLQQIVYRENTESNAVTGSEKRSITDRNALDDLQKTLFGEKEERNLYSSSDPAFSFEFVFGDGSTEIAEGWVDHSGLYLHFTEEERTFLYPHSTTGDLVTYVTYAGAETEILEKETVEEAAVEFADSILSVRDFSGRMGTERIRVLIADGEAVEYSIKYSNYGTVSPGGESAIYLMGELREEPRVEPAIYSQFVDEVLIEEGFSDPNSSFHYRIASNISAVEREQYVNQLEKVKVK